MWRVGRQGARRIIGSTRAGVENGCCSVLSGIAILGDIMRAAEKPA